MLSVDNIKKGSEQKQSLMKNEMVKCVRFTMGEIYDIIHLLKFSMGNMPKQVERKALQNGIDMIYKKIDE